MKWITTLITMSVLFSVFESKSHACGFCKGDREASVYSSAGQKYAEKNGCRYITVVLEGDFDQTMFSTAVRTLKAIPGVHPALVRSSFDQRAVSFVLERRFSIDEVKEKFQSQIPGIQMTETKDLN